MYLVKDLGPELAHIYQRYLDISKALQNGHIDSRSALKQVSELNVEDLYGGTWTIDPETGTFRREDTHGVTSSNVDPREFQPKGGFRAGTPDTSDVLEPVNLGKPEIAKPARSPKRILAWVGGGIVGLFFLLVLIGYLTGNATTSGKASGHQTTATATHRPTVPNGGPSEDRVAAVETALVSGDANSVEHVVAGDMSKSKMRYTIDMYSAMDNQGYDFQIETDDSNVAQAQFVDHHDRVIMSSDIQWTKNSTGSWVLKDLPALKPGG